MSASFHRSLKVIGFNANRIARQPYECSKQLQEPHLDVALISEIYVKYIYTKLTHLSDR
jgi:hypothetical protein